MEGKGKITNLFVSRADFKHLHVRTRFTNEEIKFIVKSLLKQINLSFKNGHKVDLYVWKIGRIHYHQNLKPSWYKYKKKRNKKDWRKKKLEIEFSEKYLLL